MIEVQDLSKIYTVHEKAPGLWGSVRSLLARKKVEKVAVRGARFSIEEGEIVGLVGANGAGKTTLVKMLAGIIHPTSGDAKVLGHRPWERHDDFRRQIALIMGQKAQLWWDLPAGDCFLLLKEIYRLEEKRYADTLAYLTEVLDVQDQIKVQIRRLSLGERMKMELIAALLHSPRVVYLDEPTIGLDLTAQRAIRDFLLSYREQHRPAMLLTSHYMEDIERLCERIIIFREGELIYDGPLGDVVAKYAVHKRVVAHLRKTDTPVTETATVRAVAEYESLDDLEIRLKVKRDQVAEASSALLAHYPVADLSIEEPDIGTIIERIIRRRSEDPS
ncbi:MAG: ATP-binding cassette domain-containing protein [Planctomycetota bacterium]